MMNAARNLNADAMLFVARKALATTDARLGERPPSTSAPLPPFISTDAALDEMVTLSKSPVYATQHATLNKALGLGGFLGGQVYDFAAGTGRGKTSFTGGLARHFADEHDVLIAFYEAFAAYPLARMVAGDLGLHSNEIIRYAERHRAAVKAQLPSRLQLLNRPALVTIRQAVDHLAQKTGKPPVLFVDYVQKLADKIQGEQKRPDARLAMSEASSGLLELADSTKALVIAVSAISRMNNRRANDPRKLAPYEFVDVAKESGAVEYDSAGLVMLSLSNDYDGDERIATMTIAKARFGEEMHVDMRFDAKRGTWRDMGRVEREPDDDLKELIRESLEKRGPADSPTDLAKRIRKNKKAVLAAIKEMTTETYEIVRNDDGKLELAS